jgi:hypothetical protein
MKFKIVLIAICFLAAGNGFRDDTMTAFEHYIKLKFPQYPYGLLNYDYGILSEFDLAQSEKVTEGVPFNGESSAYPYWQCFQAHVVKIGCYETMYDDSSRTYTTILALSGLRDGKRHSYYPRRAIDIDFCRDWLQSIKKILKNVKVVCVAGSFSGYDKEDEKRDPQDYAGWTLDRIKTSKGCWSWFDDECGPE